MQLQQSTLFCSRDSCWITDSWLLSSQQIADHRWKVSSRLILSVVVVNLERQTRARLVGISKKVKFVFLASSFVCLWDCVWFLCRYESVRFVIYAREKKVIKSVRLIWHFWPSPGLLAVRAFYGRTNLQAFGILRVWCSLGLTRSPGIDCGRSARRIYFLKLVKRYNVIEE